MIFETGDLYHIYNQGNNKQRIFFSRENYLYFLTKINQHILPHADVLAWCLMPNHFHLMVYLHTKEILVDEISLTSNSLTSSETITKRASETITKRASETMTTKTRTLNDSIGLILRPYTRAINLQENRTGSLFKPHTQSECITKSEGITPSFYNTPHGTVINVRIQEKEYPQVCFNYIHANPVRAKLVVYIN